MNALALLDANDKLRIAGLAMVSPTTLRRALRGDLAVRPSSRSRIISALRTLGSQRLSEPDLSTRCRATLEAMGERA